MFALRCKNLHASHHSSNNEIFDSTQKKKKIWRRATCFHNALHRRELFVSAFYCFARTSFVRHTSCQETDAFVFTGHQACFCMRHVVSRNRCTCSDEALNAYLTTQSFCSFSVTKPRCNMETTRSSSCFSANKRIRNFKTTSVSSR